MNNENLWTSYSEKEKQEIEKISKEYKEFLDKGKTEREVVENTVAILKENGYKDIESAKSLKEGDKVFYNNRNKNVLASIIGKDSIKKGMNMIVSHVDSPRLDLKPNPLYEDTGLAYFKTHYYGGIKKYQWTTIPLSIHGVIVKANGEKIEVNIGEDEEDPIFTITDLLPHLAQEQMEKKLKNGVDGEDLNLLIGSIPYSSSKIS